VISAEQVQKLREKTGSGMMECKRALEASQGDMEKAIQILREKGAASAARRAARNAAEGLITAYVDPAGKTAVMLELNCETDFVARTDEFVALVQKLARNAAEGDPSATTPPSATEEIAALSGKLGEKIALGRKTRYDRQGAGVFASYIHPSGGVGKVGVLVDVGTQSEKAASTEALKTLAKDLSMQIAATAPRWIRREDVPAETLKQEEAIAREQAKRENKPEKIWDKIAQGKIQQFCQQFCLLDQPFVRDSSGKTSVGSVVKQVESTVGEPVQPRRFMRYKVGEDE